MQKIIASLPILSLSILLTISGCNAQEASINQIELTAQQIIPPNSDTETLSEQQRAAQAAKEMLALAKADDWSNYIDRYYGEIQKLRSPADKDELVRRFREDKWGKIVIATLEQATQTTPEIEGDLAKFKIDIAALKQANQNTPEVVAHLERLENAEYLYFELHRTAEGEWKFHL